MIKMQVIGRLGKDCVVNTVNGKNVINFSVAHSERYKDSQGTLHEKTIWVDCAYWTDRTAISPYLLKGTQVFVEGQPEARSFTRNDGTPGSSLSLRIREVQLLGSKSDNDNAGSSQENNSEVTADSSANTSPGNEANDDLPF
ncbi:MAG: single-stranded DNA-binding protein [Chitinophagaceae bacterium]|nr:single-stranded DNA-binding protein [Chitinophagaceae bacterium]MCB0739612.1 single-stranded DNA-binding protein [Chitinophagaceae bacterium]HQU56396.1 single-stranded DNA-binding protein [Chitinophagaceae bacterium]HQV05942.1 single-stranded DNA-binding protein [Chitinophagaceae bacterium]